MTTPNIEELIERLRDAQTRGTTGEWFDRAEAANALQSQAERIVTLSNLKAVLEASAGLLRHERDTLRAELAAIAATEPVAYLWAPRKKPEAGKLAFQQFPPLSLKALGFESHPLFTRPMPAQDVTELVEVLEKAVNLIDNLNSAYGSNSVDSVARMGEEALSKYKGAK